MGNDRYLICGIMLLFVLVGCGGGSSGGESGRSSSSSPVLQELKYSGKTDPVTLSTENLADVASLLVFSRDVIALAEGMWVGLPAYRNLRVSSESETVRSGTGAATVSTKRTDEGITVTIEYDNYLAGGLTFSGTTIQTVHAPDPDVPHSGTTPMAGHTEFINYRIRTAGIDLIIDGAIKVARADFSAFRAELVLADQLAGTSSKISNYLLQFDFITKGIWAEKVIRTFISGDLYDSRLGKIALSTLEPLVGFQYREEAAIWTGSAEGSILLTGANRSARFISVSEIAAAIVTDEDGNGSFETGLRIPWSVLAGIGEFESTDAVHEPVANGGAFRRVTVGEPVPMQGLFSHDEDHEPLQHEWQLVAAPFESNLSRDPIRAASFEFVPDVLGDYVFQLRVTDGIHNSVVTTKVSAESPAWDLPKPVTGAIEVSGGVAGAPFLLNAGSVGFFVNSGEEDRSWWLTKDGTASDTAVLTSLDDVSASLSPGPTLRGTMEVSYTVNDATSTLRLNTADIGFDIRVHVNRGVGVSSSRVAAGDLNTDGMIDFVIRTPGGVQSGVDIWWGQGHGHYELVQTSVGGEYGLSLHDVDGNGLLDIITSGYQSVHVQLQDENGNYGSGFVRDAVDGNCSVSYRREIGVGDYNGDGLDDIMSFQGCTVNVWLRGEDTYDELPIIVELGVENAGYGAEFADVNNDGQLDIIVSNETKVKVLLNTDGTFTSTYVFTGEDNYDVEVAIGDLSGDGFSDLLLRGGSTAAVYKGDGTGQFSHWREIPHAELLAGMRAAVADLDADGDTDMAVASSKGLFVLVNRANGFEFVELDRQSVNTITVVDYNEDDHLDLVVPGEYLEAYLGGVRPFSQPWQATERQ